MRIAKEAIPARIDVPGARACQSGDFGDPAGSGPLAGEHVTLAAGTDIAPLLQGLDGDACQAPHWGYMLAGAVEVTYADGAAERCATGDLFFWPAGHSIRVVDDAEFVMFSPRHGHGEVMDHMAAKLAIM
jgi:hypothetical protein